MRAVGAGLDRDRDLEGLGVELAVGNLHIERELRLGLLDQALRCARVLEAEILDVLAVHGQRGGSGLGLLAGGWRGCGRGRGRHGAPYTGFERAGRYHAGLHRTRCGE